MTMTRVIAGLLLVAAICLPTQLAPAAQETDAGQSRAAPACSACMHHFPENCQYMAKAPLVAEVAGTRIVAKHEQCDELSHPNDASWCYSSIAYEFDSVRFLRNSARALPGQRFVGSFKYKRLGSETKQGIALDVGEPYMIFAGPAVADSRPPAQWFITSACRASRKQRTPASQ